VHGDTATLTGTSNLTGLGAGPQRSRFTFVVQKGGPGATSVLREHFASRWLRDSREGAFRSHEAGLDLSQAYVSECSSEYPVRTKPPRNRRISACRGAVIRSENAWFG